MKTFFRLFAALLFAIVLAYPASATPIGSGAGGDQLGTTPFPAQSLVTDRLHFAEAYLTIGTPDLGAPANDRAHTLRGLHGQYYAPLGSGGSGGRFAPPNLVAVPEPMTLLLCGTGLAGLIVRRRTRRQ